MNTFKQILALFTLLFFLFPREAVSQSLKSVVDKDNITIGDQIHLNLMLDNIDPIMFRVGKWIDFIDTANHFELIEKGPVDSLLVNGIYHLRQSFIITSFDSGVFTIPPFAVRLIHLSTENENILYSNSTSISVSPIDVSRLQAYNEVTDIVLSKNAIEKRRKYFPGIAIVLLIFLGFFFWKMKKRTKSNKYVGKSDTTLLDFTKRELQDLEKSKRTDNISARVFYNRLYHIIRNFYSKRFDAPIVINYTTSEWIFLIKNLKISDEKIGEIILLLDTTDVIRFTQINSFEEDSHTIDSAIRLLEYLDKT